MFETFDVSSDLIALYESRPRGSEVLLFKRDGGFLGRVKVHQKGNAVEQRLARSLSKIRRHTAIDSTALDSLQD